jgi:hypothetical protein
MEPPRDHPKGYDPKTRRANIRLLIILVAVAVAIYVFFILSNTP